MTNPFATLTATVALSIASCTTDLAASATTQAGPAARADDVAEIAKEAYVYGFPMIVGYKVLFDYAVDRESGQFKAPFNQIANEARVYTPADTSVSTPNSDTPYSIAWLDLRAEPVVLCVPQIEAERYYDVQLVDLYTFNYGYMGSRTTGNGAGCFMIAGPDWSGPAPDGVRQVFRCETQFSLAIFRTQLFNPSDIDNVRKVQSGYRVQPLSAYLGSDPRPAAPPIDWPRFDKAAFSTRFPEFLGFLLQFCPPKGPAAVEAPLRDRFRRVGIGAPPPTAAADAEAIGAGIKAGLAAIDEACAHIGSHVNGWQVGAAAGDRKFYNGNWTLRAAAAKLGIYGNSEAEAVYPFTRDDVHGVAIDGSKHAYTMTFAAGQLPPVHAFWSVTMYDGRTQLLIDNPINRYLINSPMLPSLRTNADGSLTIYIQRDRPDPAQVSNWLPAPDGPAFVVMRLYWPRTEAPSVYPLGKGSWAPPPIVPVRHLTSTGARRPGDKSFETIVRTDDRYGHDGLFQGPRGWSYWNHLEYPRPIQNPNLWPDTQSTYFIGRLAMPAGSSLTLHYTFPRARYFQFALYKAEHGTFVSTGEALAGDEIEPDAGSTNPFRVGADRLSDRRDFTLTIVASDPPESPAARPPNTLYAGAGGNEIQFVNRIYLSDQGSDGAGWGPASSPESGGGLPTYVGTLADGTRLSAPEVVERFGRPIEGATKQPISAEQWGMLVHAKDNDPTLDPATAPARREPRWEKYWNIRYSILGAFKAPDERAKIPFAGPIDGGGDPSTQYMLVHLSRAFGPVYVMRGKMPTFPDTYAGAGGQGLETMPDAQTRYWSIVSCEAAPSGQIVDGLTDMQVPLDKDGHYTIVCSTRDDRPSNATEENGVAWIEWSPRGEGIDGPTNRTDFGMLMMRVMATNPSWEERPDNIRRPGDEESVMGPYYPRGAYMSRATFESFGSRIPEIAAAVASASHQPPERQE